MLCWSIRKGLFCFVFWTDGESKVSGEEAAMLTMGESGGAVGRL